METKAEINILRDYHESHWNTRWVKVSDIIQMRDKAIKEAEQNNGSYDEWCEAEAYQIINTKINELSQSNPNGEILSDMKNTKVETKPLTKGECIQPMLHRPDVDKALGNGKLSNPDNRKIDQLEVSPSKSGNDTLKISRNKYICEKMK